MNYAQRRAAYKPKPVNVAMAINTLIAELEKYNCEGEGQGHGFHFRMAIYTTIEALRNVRRFF